MSIATILVPDFTLILIGFLLMRFTRWGEEFWSGLEKMVYFVLFPVLLFYSTARTPLDQHVTGKLLQVALAATIAAIALGWLAGPGGGPGAGGGGAGGRAAGRGGAY